VPEERDIRAEAWQEGVDFAVRVLRGDLEWHDRLKSKTVHYYQPVFDAINAQGLVTYSEYNAHIRSVALFSAIDLLLNRPVEGEAEVVMNPYLEGFDADYWEDSVG
jgi:hypothetical protein